MPSSFAAFPNFKTWAFFSLHSSSTTKASRHLIKLCAGKLNWCSFSSGSLPIEMNFLLQQIFFIVIIAKKQKKEFSYIPYNTSPVKMFLSSRQAGYSNRQQQRAKDLHGRGVRGQPRPEYKCEVSGRNFVEGGQIASCRHILTGLNTSKTTWAECHDIRNS